MKIDGDLIFSFCIVIIIKAGVSRGVVITVVQIVVVVVGKM